MLFDQITSDYKEAMKAKEAVKVSTLSMLRAQVKNVMIDKKLETVEDTETVAIIKKQVKQRQDSIEQYSKGGRTDLVEKEQQELDILKAYLPEELSEDQLKPIVAQSIEEVGASGMKDMGAVMKNVLEKVAGKADNKMVSAIVKDLLS